MRTNDLGITVEHGGERLYIHPIAYYKPGEGRNKVIFYHPHEFPLYNTEFVVQSDRPSDYRNIYWYQNNWLRLTWMLSGGRLLNALRVAARHCWEFKDSDFFRIFRYNLENGTPFLGVSMFEGYISVNGQIYLDDPQGWTDNSYITPSQKYLKARFDEWIAEAELGKAALGQPDPPEDDDGQWYNEFGHLKYRAETLIEYREWEAEWLGKGCAIGFVCALDT